MPSPDNQPQSETKRNEDDEPQEPVRELTQTDRLNNRLLKSFLAHVNAGQVDNDTKNGAEPDEEDRSNEFED